MTKYQKYCTHCGKKIKEYILDYDKQTRYHPMEGQKQFRRVWKRLCSNHTDSFSEHYGYETKWEWVDV